MTKLERECWLLLFSLVGALFLRTVVDWDDRQEWTSKISATMRKLREED